MPANGKIPAPTYQVRDDYTRAPARDGTMLHLRLWRPITDEPLPVVINYDPYRSSDTRTLGRGNVFHYLARHGFIVAHLSVRGTDASDGIATDEYALVEQTDGYDTIEWLAEQSWCNGSIGMIGTSYSGFTALQVAMHRPPHLKAIVPINATDDRYTDDIHFRGGTLHTFDQLTTYGVNMGAMNALPTLPEHAGSRWLDQWTEHLEGNPIWLLSWLEHQTDGPYWRGASLRPGYDRIVCPVFISGGWFDAYRNATLRIFQHLSAPKKCIVGPWTHSFPDYGVPGPNVDFMAMVARFFDHWLKGNDTGFMDEPAFLVYMQRYLAPTTSRTFTPGFWRAEPAFPLPGTSTQTLYFGDGGSLSGEAGRDGVDEYAYRATVGTQDTGWGGCPWLGGPADQRPDELYSLVYTTEPLPAEIQVVGNPRAIVHFASSATIANLVCKLSEVGPDGSSSLVTSGVLNVTHRKSHEQPEALVPGEVYACEVELDSTGYIFTPGSRLRLAVTSGDWPNTWPSPDPATNRVSFGQAAPSRLDLPVVPAKSESEAPKLDPPRMPNNVYTSRGTGPSWDVKRDMRADAVTVTIHTTGGGRPSPVTEVVTDQTTILTASDRDPAVATCDSRHSIELRRPTETVGARVSSHFTSSRDAFHLTYDLVVTLDGREHFARSWRRSYPRMLV